MRSLRVLILLALVLASGAARANGALPATIEVLLPEAAPKTTFISTNFGLISTTDGGGSWRWICEHDLGDQGSAYQVNGSWLFALATAGIVGSVDQACGWSLLMDETTAIPIDYFPDPSDPTRLLVLGILRSQQRAFAVLELKLSGTGQGTLTQLYAPPVGDELTTVEVSRSNPKIAYATIRAPNGVDPGRVVRTEDGGKTWTVSTPDPLITELKILAVDRSDPNTIYFRVPVVDGDQLYVSTDGGKTVKKALAPSLVMSSFHQLANGHLLVGWLDIDRGYLDRSTDGGVSFTRLSSDLHFRSLADRDGKVYAAVDFLVDDYVTEAGVKQSMVLAASPDEGTTWERVMGLDDVVANSACGAARSTCASLCQSLVNKSVFKAPVCAAFGGAPLDGGAKPMGDGGVPADAHAAVDAPASAQDAALVTPLPSSSQGCSCALGGRDEVAGGGRAGGVPGGAGASVLLVVATLTWRRRRQR